MKKIETYHYEFLEAGTHTFELPVKPYELLVKNLTSDKIYMSYGTEIDTENDSYSVLPKNTAETFREPLNDDSTSVNVTVEAEGTGLVELRIVDY